VIAVRHLVHSIVEHPTGESSRGRCWAGPTILCRAEKRQIIRRHPRRTPIAPTVADGIVHAMRPLGARGPARVRVAADGNRYAAMGRFRNAPHDVVLAIAEQIDGAWKITGLPSVLEH
jgi:hypothetical protein